MIYLRNVSTIFVLCLCLGYNVVPAPAQDNTSDAIGHTLGTGVYKNLSPDRPPRIIRRIEPIYPPAALEKKIQGIVNVRITISNEGKVTDISVIDGIPEGVFDENALKAVKYWEFEPAFAGGMPVDSGITTPLIFELDSAKLGDPIILAEKSNALYAKAWSKSNEGKNSEALGLFKELITLAPKNPEAYYGLGFNYQALGEFMTANYYYCTATNLNFQDAAVYFNRGMVLLKLKEYVHAINDFDHFINIEPKNPKGYTARAVALKETGEDFRACEDFVMACKLGDCVALDSLRQGGACTEEFDFEYISKLIRIEKFEEGIPLLKRCAESGHGGCMALLAQVYSEGKGISKNAERAIYWNKKAYATGINYGFAGIDGATSLAMIYLDGLGVEKNPKIAVSWVKKAYNLCLNPGLSEWDPNHLTEFCPNIKSIMDGLGTQSD